MKGWARKHRQVLFGLIAGLLILTICLTGLREPRIELELVNQTGQPVSDIDVMFASRRDIVEVVVRPGEPFVQYADSARRMAICRIEPAGREVFRVREPEIFHVKVLYRDHEAHQGEVTAYFFPSDRVAIEKARVLLQPGAPPNPRANQQWSTRLRSTTYFKDKAGDHLARWFGVAWF